MAEDIRGGVFSGNVSEYNFTSFLNSDSITDVFPGIFQKFRTSYLSAKLLMMFS